MNLNLDYRGFEDYLIKERMTQAKDGIQYIFKFENNHGASIMKHSWSDGYEDNLWELAVIDFIDDENNFEVNTRSELTRDVLGYLTDEEVKYYMGKIKDF